MIKDNEQAALRKNEFWLASADKLVCVMTSGQYSSCLLLNADWLIQILEGLAVCKVVNTPAVNTEVINTFYNVNFFGQNKNELKWK